MVEWKFNISPGTQPKITSLEQQEAPLHHLMLKVFCAVLKTAPYRLNCSIFKKFVVHQLLNTQAEDQIKSFNWQQIVVKLRSRSRSGEGQVRVRRVRRVRFGPELYNIF